MGVKANMCKKKTDVKQGIGVILNIQLIAQCFIIQIH